MAIYIIAEIGINHNGSLEMAKELMDVAKAIGAEAVKFQKRTIEAVYTEEELASTRESVFGTTNGDLKRGLEFGRADYDALFDYSQSLEIDCAASCWDPASVAFIAGYGPPWLKIPSALITDVALLKAYRQTGLPLLVSTGMSTCDVGVRSGGVPGAGGGEEVDHGDSAVGGVPGGRGEAGVCE